MARIVVLDAHPLGLACKPRGTPDGDRCNTWLKQLDWAGVLVYAPEIADFEVRRALIKNGATAGLRRLDDLMKKLCIPVTTPALRLAADYWAHVRRAGLPTADTRSLDADCIIAAQATLVCGLQDVMTIATSNRKHLARFPSIDARPWESIIP